MGDVALAIDGVRLATAAGGIRYRDRDDLALIEIAAGASVAAVFTRNAFCAAPVLVAREHLRSASARYLLINSGNANAGTGEQGLAAARRCCELVAAATGTHAEQTLPFSTGVIGAQLPLAPFERGVPKLVAALDADAWPAVARAIMTTDTVMKLRSASVQIGADTVSAIGIAKGAGMIRPDMATMLAYVATDAALSPELAQRCLDDCVAESFNSITVDGDTSTNDACVLIATGRDNPIVSTDDPRYAKVYALIAAVCMELAQAIVRDAEGATHFVTIDVSGARDQDEARRVAFTIAHSPLVKTALSAGDPNWGRILAAVGRAGVVDLRIDRVAIRLGEHYVIRNGLPAAEYTESAGQAALAGVDQFIGVELGLGEAHARVWTSDLTCDYVRINASYRS
ncbi:MAG: bifunctional glutamate N-acetyltransferase/amino-acid acetyltransferase ArgJ [Chromatiales bacterium]|nr:bifunctional glutamate N-acetyltransferase/amino-acid acetyltransferase ArgJ [Chromatiales bacterium]